jgi:heme oxygenase (mycobilin-producing)
MMNNTNGAVTLINLFEVPPESDEEFIGGWEMARDYLLREEGLIDSALHRSLAPSADFRFVNVAHWRSPQQFQAAIAKPDFPGSRMPFTAHASLYRVVREDDGDDPNAPVLINAFEVPAGKDEEFISAWEGSRDVLRSRPGYVATQLHQSLSPDAEFQFVNIARWASPQEFQAAVQDPRFREVSAMPYKPHPSLYEVIRT